MGNSQLLNNHAQREWNICFYAALFGSKETLASNNTEKESLFCFVLFYHAPILNIFGVKKVKIKKKKKKESLGKISRNKNNIWASMGLKDS